MLPHASRATESGGASERQLRLSRPLNRIAIAIAFMVMLTSSFDIFLVIQIGGTFRFCQVIAPGLVALALLRCSRGFRIPLLGSRSLLAWLIVQIVFVPVASYWLKSLSYCLWLGLNIGLVFSFVQLFADDWRTLEVLLRGYLYSFGIVAAFGIIQFSLPITGVGSILVTQWWIEEVVPRVNGLSYEPSYFACYLLIGFVFVAALRRTPFAPIRRGALHTLYWMLMIGIVLSSSRIGIAFLLVDLFLYYSTPWLRLVRNLLTFRGTFVKPRELARLPVLLCISIVFALEGATVLQNDPAVVLTLLNGTGVAGTHAHSVVERGTSLVDTLTVFVQHPIIGQSLGGVSSAIADLHGETVSSFEESKPFEGMSVFAEALAASGVIGVVPLIVFLVITVRKPLKLAQHAGAQYSSLLRALVRSLIFAWAVLQFNQNILRPYLWVHIAILATVYAAALRFQHSAKRAS